MEIAIVGRNDRTIRGSRTGVDVMRTMIMVGIRFKIPCRAGIFMKRGTNSTKVAKKSNRVMAEFASLVLSTSMEIITPSPIKINPTKNKSTKSSKLW